MKKQVVKAEVGASRVFEQNGASESRDCQAEASLNNTGSLGDNGQHQRARARRQSTCPVKLECWALRPERLQNFDIEQPASQRGAGNKGPEDRCGYTDQPIEVHTGR